MYPTQHGSAPSLPNVVLTASTQHLAGPQTGNGQGYVHLPSSNQHFALQASAPPHVHRMSLTSQCYPATFLAARQHYGGNLIYGQAHGANCQQAPGVPYLKKRTVFPKHVTNKLRQWLKDNIENPFPDEEQKDQLCKDTKLTLIQLNYWFINARRRIWPGLRDEINKERAKNNLPPIQLPLNRRGKDSEPFDQDENDGDLMTDDGDDGVDELAEGCVMLQTVSSAQLKNVRKASISSSSDLSSSTNVTSTEDIPSMRLGLNYTAHDTQFAPPSQSSDSASGDDQLASGSGENLSAVNDTGDATLCRPSSRLANGLQPAPACHYHAGKREPRLLLQAHRRMQLDANRLAPSLMQSAPCIYKPSSSTKDADGQRSQHHYQSMPQIHPPVPVTNHRQTSSIYLPSSNLANQTASHESSAASSPAGSQYFAMIPSPSSVTNQVQHLHLGSGPFVQTTVTPPQQQPPQQPIVFLMPPSQHSGTS